MTNVSNLLNTSSVNSFEKAKYVDLSSDIHLKLKDNFGVNIREDYNFVFLEGVLDGYSDKDLEFSNFVDEKLKCDPQIKNCLQDLLNDPKKKLNNEKQRLVTSTPHFRENLKRLKKLIFNANNFGEKFEESYQEGDEEGLLESRFEGAISGHGSVRVFSVFEDDLVNNKLVFVVLLVDPYHMGIPTANKNQKSFDEVKFLNKSIKDIFYNEKEHVRVNFISKEQFLNQFL